MRPPVTLLYRCAPVESGRNPSETFLSGKYMMRTADRLRSSFGLTDRQPRVFLRPIEHARTESIDGVPITHTDDGRRKFISFR